MNNVIDLSSSISMSSWEPEPIKRKIIDHKSGADKLGESYLYFHANNIFKKIWYKYFKMGKYTISHIDFPNKMGLSLMWYELTTHTGTHIDSPFHYGWNKCSKKPASVTEIPLEWFYSDGILLDFTSDNEQISADTIRQKIMALNYTIKENDIVLINTGASKLYGKRDYFTNYKAIDKSAIELLLDFGVKIIGTDAFSFDPPFKSMIDDFLRTKNKQVLWPSHFYGREKPYIQIERMNNLEKIPQKFGFKVCCFPIKLEDADAAWCRAVAIL